MVLQKELECVKMRVFDLLKRDFLREDDIINLYDMSFDDITILGKSEIFKDKVLTSIYFNPYLICNDKLIEVPILNIDTIAKLLIKRFNEEIYEYKIRLNEGEISEMEYNNNQLYLNYLYFESTFIGRKVSRYYQDKILDIDNKYCNRLLKK